MCRTRGNTPILIWSLLAAAVVAACGDSGDPTSVLDETPVPAQVVVPDEEITLYVNSSTGLGAFVRDQFGHVMAGVPLTFLSRDPSTASVDASGLVAAAGAGETWVVAVSGSLSDSARIVVRFDVLAGEARVRVRGSRGLDQTRGWDIRGVYYDRLGSTDADRFLLSMATSRGDTGIAVVFPQIPASGRTDIGATSLAELMESSDLFELPHLAYLLMVDGDDALIYVATEGGRIEVDSHAAAAGFGQDGILRARVVFRGRGYRIRDDMVTAAEAVPTGDSVVVYADVAAEYTWSPEASASYTLSGGPLPGASENAYAMWFGFYGNPDTGEVVVYGDGSYVRLLLARPQVGTQALKAVDPDNQTTTSFPAVVVNLPTAPDYYVGYSQSGSVTLDVVEKPTGSAWGQLKGSVASDLLYRSQWSTTPDSEGTLTMSFHIPLEPEEGWSAPALRGDHRERRSIVGMLDLARGGAR